MKELTVKIIEPDDVKGAVKKGAGVALHFLSDVSAVIAGALEKASDKLLDDNGVEDAEVTDTGDNKNE